MDWRWGARALRYRLAGRNGSDLSGRTWRRRRRPPIKQSAPRSVVGLFRLAVGAAAPGSGAVGEALGGNDSPDKLVTARLWITCTNG